MDDGYSVTNVAVILSGAKNPNDAYIAEILSFGFAQDRLSLWSSE